MEVQPLAMAPTISPSLKRQEVHTKEKEYQRAYKACIACRKRKAKCDLSSSGQPPCARCRREHRECVFPAERSGNPIKRQKIGVHEAEPTADVSNRYSQDHASLDFATSTRYHNNESSDTMSASPPGPRHGKKIGLDDSVMRTVVSRGNEALDILFEAAAHQERASASNAQSGSSDSSKLLPQPSASSTAPVRNQAVTLSSTTAATLELWSNCRFVSQGWLSAQEAITYIDLFFEHMCPLSPIISDFYGKHHNHRQLLTDEPVLCCTILAISSRYHVLPGIGGASRSTLIHDRLWRVCQDLLTRTIFGQEKGASPKTRAIGTIEALLLISEWNPRSLHFPPDNCGWNSHLLLNSEYRHHGGTGQRHQLETSAADQWLNDVLEPARRSDRMSWMLLGSAVTLAHELGIFEGDANPTVVGDRRLRVQKLLYVYENHLASRLGYISLIPQSMNQLVSRHVFSTDPAVGQWQAHMSSWIELTQLVKSVYDNFFSSPALTSHLLRTGRYIDLLQQFLPKLDHWRRVHLEAHSYQGYYQETLFIEYHYVRVYINSLGMQAACERALANAPSDSDPRASSHTRIDSLEYECIKEVIDGCCEILRKVISLAETDTLRFGPVRLFLRITTSSIFLLKALSLGVRNTQLQYALDILDSSINALKTSNLDEMHLAARYATLLDTHVQKVRQGFVPNPQRQPHPMNNDLAPTQTWTTNGEPLDYAPLEEMSGDDWLSLPFDPSMAPFAPDGTVDFSGLNGGALDFIWNLPPE